MAKRCFKQPACVRKSLGSAILMRQSEADNPSGLRYYAKLGFIEYQRIADVALSNGMVVDKVCTAFSVVKPFRQSIDRAVRRVRALWGAKLLLIPFKARPLKTDTSCKSHYIPI